MVETVEVKDIDHQIAEAEQELSGRVNQIRELVDRIADEQAPEDRVVLKNLFSCTDRFMFLAAWIRSKLDAGQETVLLDGLRELFDEGEDDFEAYYPALATTYEAAKRVEQLYTQVK